MRQIKIDYRPLESDKIACYLHCQNLLSMQIPLCIDRKRIHEILDSLKGDSLTIEMLNKYMVEIEEMIDEAKSELMQREEEEKQDESESEAYGDTYVKVCR